MATPIEFECPHCGRQQRARAEHAGQAKRCLYCGQGTTVPGEAAAPVATDGPGPTPESTARPEASLVGGRGRGPNPAAASRATLPSPGDPGDLAPARRGSKVLPSMHLAPGWRTTRSGLSTIHVGISILIVAVVFVLVAGLAAGNAGRGSGSALTALAGIASLGALGGMVAAFVGQCMCCTVPRESGGGGLVVGSVVLTAGGILLPVLALSIRRAEQVQALLLVAWFEMLVGSLLFLLFLRAVARYFAREEVASAVVRYIVFAVCSIPASFLVGLLSSNLGRKGEGVVLLLVYGIVILAISVIWYLRLIRGTRDAIGAPPIQTAVFD